jgi:hypothetical protein
MAKSGFSESSNSLVLTSPKFVEGGDAVNLLTYADVLTVFP